MPPVRPREPTRCVTECDQHPYASYTAVGLHYFKGDSMRTRLVGVVAVFALAAGLMVSGAGSPVSATSSGGVVDLTDAVPATFTVEPGVEQLTVRGGPIRGPLTLVHADTLERIVTLYTDDLGQLTYQYVPDDFLVFDQQTAGILPTVNGSTVPPGTYRVISEGVPGEPFVGTVEASDPFDVLDVDDVPDVSLYENQVLPFVSSTITGGEQDGSTAEDGYGYLETRDGTLLSINVRLPDPGLYGDGPYPTVVQYSGYAPSKPGTPTGPDAGGMLAGVFGFAYVGVNVRGSGCSGGVFDVFNAAQAADGYDVIETVARQPWVKHGHVGMMGISYSGITQLYVGATNPPSLAAITPMSVIEDPWDQQWPGGIYNAGFTKQWLAQRDDEAAGGAQWVKDRISGGDTTCEDNLTIRTQNVPFEDFALTLDRRPVDADSRNISIKVKEIDVPVYLSGAWQDEQTGSRFGVLLDDFTSVPAGQSKFTMYNGHHPDALSPLVMSRWFEFLSFYVDREIPFVNTSVRAFAEPVLAAIFGVDGYGFEANRFYEFGTTTPEYGDFETTLEVYEGESPVRVLFEVGFSPNFPDDPMAHQQRWSLNFPSWPPPDASPTMFYLGHDGMLQAAAPETLGIDRYSHDAGVLAERYFVSGDHGNVNVVNDWKVTADGVGLAYESAPLEGEMIVAGEGYVDLWFRSTGTDAPIEVVLSEVYADPNPDDEVPPEEVRVQHGLLRAGYRNLDPDRSTDLLKEHLFYTDDYELLELGHFVNVQVPIYPVAHPFRAGSTLRLEINTAGGDSALWDFESSDFGATTHDVALGGVMASSLVLPVLPYSNIFRRIPTAFAPQEARPQCDWLRGQPCRDHSALTNQTVHTSAACDPTRFTDVNASNSACANITWLSDNAIAGGFLDGTYRPTASVTRGAMAKFLYGLSGSPNGPSPTCTEAPFVDIAVSHLFCGEITWLATTGVTQGYGDDTFRPGLPVTRELMAALLYRLAGSPDGTNPTCSAAPLIDVAVTDQFCGEITWLSASGITLGYPDGTFRPTVSVNRQAMAAFLERFRIFTV